MHSRIIELSKDPILKHERMCESSVPDWFYHSIADYTDADTDRDHDIKWFLDAVARVVDVAEDGKSFTFKPKAKQKYFERQYHAFLDKACELTGISLDAFVGEAKYDIGMAMYKLNEHYQDMKRNVKTLHTLFPDLEDRKPMSLFGDGDFGEEGAFFIPVETPDLNRRLHEAGPYPEGLDNKFSMNKPPNPCPSLYCDLVLLNDPNNGRSYLGWNEAEKSYYITDWIELIAGWLSERGYHLDGKMFAVVEGGMSYYTITVDGAKVTSTEFTPEATYVSEFNDLLYED